MKKIFDFFLKNYDYKSDIDLKKARVLFVVDIVGALLVTIIVISHFVRGRYGSAVATIPTVIIALTILFLIQRGKIILAGNILAFSLCLMTSLKAIFNFSKSPVFNYFMDEFYVLLFIIVFSAMFASRMVFIINFIISLLSTLIAIIITKSELPENISDFTAVSIPSYYTIMALIFVLTFFFTKFINMAVEDLLKNKKIIENQNIIMQKMVAGIKKNSKEIAGASNILSSVSQQISQSTGEQASAIEEISAATEQMLSTINSNTEKAEITGKITKKTAEEINSNNETFTQTIKYVSEISKKTFVISDIAFQTNILSLNAAIQAALAGNYGKGFAVVAQEIKNLSEKSRIASDEINELSENGQSISKIAGEKFEKIIPEIIKSAELVNNIISASREQQTGIKSINSSINQLTEITNENSASAEEMSASAKELSNRAEQLKILIADFKL